MRCWAHAIRAAARSAATDRGSSGGVPGAAGPECPALGSGSVRNGRHDQHRDHDAQPDRDRHHRVAQCPDCPRASLGGDDCCRHVVGLLPRSAPASAEGPRTPWNGGVHWAEADRSAEIPPGSAGAATVHPPSYTCSTLVPTRKTARVWHRRLPLLVGGLRVRRAQLPDHKGLGEDAAVRQPTDSVAVVEGAGNLKATHPRGREAAEHLDSGTRSHGRQTGLVRPHSPRPARNHAIKEPGQRPLIHETDRAGSATSDTRFDHVGISCSRSNRVVGSTAGAR